MKWLDYKKIRRPACRIWFTWAIVTTKAVNKWSKIRCKTLRVPSILPVKSLRNWWQSIMHLKVQREVAHRESLVLVKAYSDKDIAKQWSVRSPYSKLAHVISLRAKNVEPLSIIPMHGMIIINQRLKNRKTGRLLATCFVTWLMQSMYMIRITIAS